MAANGIEALKAELGPAASQLPDLARVPNAAVLDLAQALREARATQRQLLADSAEHSLRLVPALLRPVVRKVLFG